MVKISGLPSDNSPTLSDLIPLVDVEQDPPRTEHVTLQDLITAIFNNVPAGAIPGSVFDYVVSGGVWTADSAGSNRNASMTALTVYINSRTIAVDAVVARTFTPSKDTYVDLLDNLDGTGTLVYTEVANNAASPALAANSIRLAIIVTAAGSIAAAGSINQGQEDRVVPIASSIPYTVTDSLGNLICPRDPQRKLLGYRQITSNFTVTSATQVQITGLTCPVIVPTGRKVEIEVYSGSVSNDTANRLTVVGIWDGVVTVGTQLDSSNQVVTNANVGDSMSAKAQHTPSAASKTYNAALSANIDQAIFTASATAPAFIRVKLL